MRLSSVLHLLGKMLLYLALILLIPLIVTFFEDFRSWLSFAYSIIITGTLSVILMRLNQKPEKLSSREGFLIVTLAWCAYAFFGGLPYLFDGVFVTLTDAFFESMSGFTTTGSTVLTEIEGLSMGILFWRSLTQFLGGMGIIVLGLAILPEISLGAMQLFKAEVPGPTKDRLFPRMKDTAKMLWGVYILLAVVEVTMLMFCGFSLFDAINHAFTTMATGGFSTKNVSILGFGNPGAEWVMILFMFLAGVNFTLHYNFLRGRLGSYLKNGEFRAYFYIFAISTLLVAINIYPQVNMNVSGTIRTAAFQVISILTTTGYASLDFELWAPFSQVLLFLLMFVGAMAGSTGGGIKVVRILLYIKQILLQLRQLFHPNIVAHIKSGGKVVSENIMAAVAVFLMLYVAIFVLAILILSAFGIDFVTSLSAAASCLGNIGPGFGTVGAMDNYAHLPTFIKNLLSFLMLLGRLELYTIIVLFLPSFWKD